MLATTIHKSNTTPHHQRWSNNKHRSPPAPNTWELVDSRPDTSTNAEDPQGLLSQSPIVCLAAQHPPNGKAPKKFVEAPEPPPLQRTAHPTNRPDHRTPTRVGGPESRGAP